MTGRWSPSNPARVVDCDRGRARRSVTRLGLLGWLLIAAPLAAQVGAAPPADRALPSATAGTSANGPQREPPQSFLEIVHAGGLVGYATMLLSVAAAAVAIEHLLVARRQRLFPEELLARLKELVQQGQYAKAAAAARQSDAFLGHVLAAGLNEADADWPTIEKTVEDTLAEHAARLYRRIEYISLIGNLAPMLGLLGTVIGMVMAFREVAVTQGAARAADLAEGIYLALVTTVQGLVVAIPALGVFALLRNRLDSLLAEAAAMASSTLAPLRRARAAREPVPPHAREGAR